MCALCVADKERGLNIQNQLGDAEKEVVNTVRRCLEVHGPPLIELISSQVIYIPSLNELNS